eukprot:scaffold34938_cov261-Amphora_coffeaeformis.AAC.1
MFVPATPSGGSMNAFASSDLPGDVPRSQEGIAVEDLRGNFLNDPPSAPVRAVLGQHDGLSLYTEMKQAIKASKKTRGMLGGWKDKDLGIILRLFHDQFRQKGVQVGLCKKTSASGTFLWFEFVDMNVVPGYASLYHVSPTSSSNCQQIRTRYNKLTFPRGVVVTEIMRGSKALLHVKNSQRNKTLCPVAVRTMLLHKHEGLLEVYHSLLDALSQLMGAAGGKGWNSHNLEQLLVAQDFLPRFAQHNVHVFSSYTKEFVMHVQYGGTQEVFRWIEFVDRDVQPDYEPRCDS